MYTIDPMTLGTGMAAVGMRSPGTASYIFAAVEFAAHLAFNIISRMAGGPGRAV